MTPLNRIVWTTAALCSFIAATQSVHAQSVWNGTNGVSPDMNWSSALNWSPATAPGVATNVLFTNNVGAFGPASTIGTVDNIVDGGFAGTIASLQFANTNTSGGSGYYHTTQIGASQTLTVLGNLRVGFDADVPTSQIYSMFTGAGTLVLSNATAGLNVSQGDNGNACQATLNLTNLNNFNATLGGITVGVYNTPNPSVARQKGFLFLARTNVLTFAGNAARAYGNESQIEIGENLGNGSNVQVPMYLGIMNTINVNSISVGGDKQGSGALLAFNPVFTNAAPIGVFRGTNGGSSRVSVWRVGDNSNQTTTGSGASGTVDFSNGSLDAMVDTMLIGIGESGPSSGTGNGTGTFTFNRGTNDVNLLIVGDRVATGGNSAPPGTMNVNGTATLVVNNAVCLSFYVANSGSTYGAGTLNVNGGTVLANTITNGVAAGANTTANINVTGGTLGITSLAGVVGTPDAPIKNLSLSDATLQLQVSGFQTNIETTTLTLAGTTNVVNFSYLPPLNSYPATNALIGFQILNGSLNLGISSFPAASPPYQGYITNDANTVYLVLTSGPTVGSTVDIWTGKNGTSWDFATLNWTSLGSPTTFINGAPVRFDDTSSNSIVNLTTSLLPASVTVSNNTLNYALGGTGKLSGSGSLTKSGNGTLLITNTGVNDFLGAVTINAGTVQFGNGSANGILPSGGTVLDSGNLVFNRSGNVLVPNAISGAGTITKNGSSVLTMSGSNSFSGTMVVNNGTMVLNGVLSGRLTNAAGSVMGGSGTNAGAVNIAGLLQPSASVGTPATFTSGDTLSVASGGSLAFNLSGSDSTPGNGINDLLAVGGDLDLNNNIIALNFLGVPQPGVPYTLINFSGAQNGSFNSTVAGTHFGSILNQGTSPVQVTLTGTGANLKWDATTNNLWNLGSVSNWLNQGSSVQDVFYQGDTVVFDDSVAGVTNNVSIASGVAVSPTLISNNSSSINYTIAGPGQLSGNVQILKQGNSTLTIAAGNPNFTGTATVQAGTLRAGSGAAFGTGETPGTVVVTNAGTLDFNGAGLGEVTVIVSGAGMGGNGAIVNSGADQIHAINIVKLSGDATFGGPGRWDVRINGLDNAQLTTTDFVTHNIVKKGTNLVALVTCSIDPSIGDIDIQAGSFSLQLAGTSQNSSGWFADTARTISVQNGGEFGLNTLGSAFPLYRTVALNNGSLLTSSAGDNALGGSVLLSGNATINVIGGTSPWLLINGIISGSGNLIKTGPLTLTLTGTNTYTGNTVVNAGTIALTIAGTGSEGSISTSSSILIAAGATVDASARSDGTFTIAPSQDLQGNGTVAGNLTVSPGAAVSGGTNSVSVGTLTVTANAALQGTTLMKLNRAGATNDMLAAASITFGGTLALTNVSASALQAGDSFQLFAAPSLAGAFSSLTPASPGFGLAWNTNNLAVNGVLSVVSTVVAQPRITSFNLSGGSLVLSGTNGSPNATFYLLQSTNVALPVASWTSALTNHFDANGNFSVTNAVDVNKPKLFYLLQVPTP
jgi:autotransporter-associated beta strand protein